jgi:hypothetical protein
MLKRVTLPPAVKKGSLIIQQTEELPHGGYEMDHCLVGSDDD